MYIPFFIFGPILLITASIFSTVWLRSKRIIGQGKTTIATVTDVAAVSSSVSPGERGVGGKFFKPAFEWTVNGQIYKKAHNVAHDPPKYHIGQELSIYYDPANPAEMTLEGSGKVTKILMLSFGVAGVLFLLIGALLWI